MNFQLFLTILTVCVAARCKTKKASVPAIIKPVQPVSTPPKPPAPAKLETAPAPKKQVAGNVEEVTAKGVVEQQTTDPQTLSNPPKLSYDQQKALDLHNQVRNAKNLNSLTWDVDLENSARRYSNILFSKAPNPRNLHLEHDDQDKEGENLYVSSELATLAKGTQAWMDEEKMYIIGTLIGHDSIGGIDIKTGQKGNFTFHEYGHWTQMLFHTVTKEGCAGDTKENRYITCRYDSIQLKETLPYPLNN